MIITVTVSLRFLCIFCCCFNVVANGPKEHVNENEDFDSWRVQQHQVNIFIFENVFY